MTPSKAVSSFKPNKSIKRKEKKSDIGFAVPVVATSNDVLFGRSVNHFSGNRYFRSIIRSKTKQYSTCLDNRGKHLLAEFVIQEISNHGGRFLRRVSSKPACPKTEDQKDLWEIVDHSTALAKVKQAFRDTISADRRREDLGAQSGLTDQNNKNGGSLINQTQGQQVSQQLPSQETADLAPSFHQVPVQQTSMVKAASEIMLQQQEKMLQQSNFTQLEVKQKSNLTSKLAANSPDQSRSTFKSFPNGLFGSPYNMSMNTNRVAIAHPHLEIKPSATTEVADDEFNRLAMQRRTNSELPATTATKGIAFQTSTQRTQSFGMNYRQCISQAAAASEVVSQSNNGPIPEYRYESIPSTGTFEFTSLNNDTPLPNQLPPDMQKQLVDLLLPSESRKDSQDLIGE